MIEVRIGRIYRIITDKSVGKNPLCPLNLYHPYSYPNYLTHYKTPKQLTFKFPRLKSTYQPYNQDEIYLYFFQYFNNNMLRNDGFSLDAAAACNL